MARCVLSPPSASRYTDFVENVAVRLFSGGRRISCWLLLAGVCSACVDAHAQEPSRQAARGPAFVLAQDALAGSPIGSFRDVLEDPSGALTLTDVQEAPHAQRFERSREPMLGFGLTIPMLARAGAEDA